MLRVMVVDDSSVARNLLVEILNSEPDVEVVGEAINGADAVDMVPELKPDVITMDVRMPGLDGYSATREIMMTNPTPIVVVSGSMGRADVQKSMQALDAGALAVIGKPASPASRKFEAEAKEFVNTIRTMAAVRVIRRHRPRTVVVEPTTSTESPLTLATRPRLVVIAASTGGPQALRTLLGQIPADFPLPIVVVQHISDGFTEGLADWLGRSVDITLQVAQDGDRLKPGTAYFAPEGHHCTVDSDARIVLDPGPPIGGFRPSATVLFESASRAFGNSVIAVILTGMGSDGVDGLRSVRQTGGVVIGQDEPTSVVYGMPKAAADAGVVDKVLPLHQIARELTRMAISKN